MTDARKIIIIFVVAVLFSVLVFAVIEAVYPSPEWQDYCRNDEPQTKQPCISEKTCPEINVSQSDREACEAKEGYIEFVGYNTNNCPTAYECNTCQHEFEDASKTHQIYVFYISAFLALIAVFFGLYLPAKGNALNEWIGTGFMLGGTFALFFGTLQSFIALDRYTRPIVIFLELALVIFMAYKKIGNLREDKKPGRKR